MSPLVDVHTHIYPPSYISLLSNRKQTPYIYQPPQTSSEIPQPSPRLIILPSDDDPAIPISSRGRPIDASYSSISNKLSFMAAHNISASLISLANPWLDFLPPNEAAGAARLVNDDMISLCETAPGKLFALGTLPLSAPAEQITTEIKRLAGVPAIRGVILGTTGLGEGLDDPALEPLWTAVEETGLLIFLHPHYGLPGDVFGPRARDSGHVLPLALGFPLETTIAFTRMYLAGAFEAHPRLKMLLAHAGGTMPFLAGRIESCVLHEREFFKAKRESRARLSIWEVLKRNVWLDGVVYSPVGVKAAVEAVGEDRVLWGTDHPFFPPVGEEENDEGGEWLSVKTNIDAVRSAFGDDREGAERVLGSNAIKLLWLEGVT